MYTQKEQVKLIKPKVLTTRSSTVCSPPTETPYVLDTGATSHYTQQRPVHQQHYRSDNANRCPPARQDHHAQHT
jgi:hypothetical protein